MEGEERLKCPRCGFVYETGRNAPRQICLECGQPKCPSCGLCGCYNIYEVKKIE